MQDEISVMKSSLRSYLKKVILEKCPYSALLRIKKLYYSFQIRRFSEPELAILRRIINQGDNVLDIGANIGWYSLFMAKEVGPNGIVFSVEPVPESYEILKHCMKNIRNVRLFNVAISNTSNIVSMEIPKYTFGGDNFYRARMSEQSHADSNRMIWVMARTLDSMLLEMNKKIDFIKCDVEGHELEVIKGAEQLIKKWEPAWLIEISETEECHSKSVFDYFAENGYEAFRIKGEKLVKAKNGDRAINYFFFKKRHMNQITDKFVL